MKDIFKTKSLSDIHSMLINKEITSVQLTEVSLKLAENNKNLNAFITLSKEQAIENAEKCDEKIKNGNCNILTGIPLAVKDNICTKDIKTTCASKMLEGFIPPYSATAVKNSENCGMVVIGKTNMDEFAMGSSSKTSYFGKVLNPYNQNFVAGGSSGGSAAAVASGICPFALGSDTGGSVRQPASFCGVTAIKPTYGSISRYGLIAFASSLDQIGLIGNSAEDLNFLLDAVAKKDKNDMTSLNEGFKKFSADIKGKIIGIPKEYFDENVNGEVADALIKAITVYKSLGAEIKEISLPSTHIAPTVYSVISSAEAASNLARYDGVKYGYRCTGENSFEDMVIRTRGEAFGFEVKRRIMLGNFVLSEGNFAEYYQKALELRERIKNEFKEVFKTVDVILHPTAPTTAFCAENREQNEKSEAADVLTLPASLAGLPSATTTCGYDKNGLPIGMSVTADKLQDKLCLFILNEFEKSFDRRYSKC